MRKVLAVLLVAGLTLGAVALGGCRPQAEPAAAGLFVSGGGISSVNAVNVTGDMEVTVGDTAFAFHATLGPPPAEEWYGENVEVTGSTAEVFHHRDPNTGMESLTVQVPRGQPGQTVIITVTGILLPDQDAHSVTVTAHRVALPHVSAEVLEGGTWRALPACPFLTQRPVELRFTFSNPMDRASVVETLRELPAQPKWTDDKTLFLKVEDPPGAFKISIEDARDQNGLEVQNSLPAIYTVEPPRLWLYDPARDEEKALCEAPSDVCQATISPDGRTLACIVFINRTNFQVTSVVDVATGSRSDFEEFYQEWTGAGLLVLTPIDGRGLRLVDRSGKEVRQVPLPCLAAPAVSPDGRQAAYLSPDYEGSQSCSYGLLVPQDLVLVDVETRQERVISEDFIQVYSDDGGSSPFIAPDWSPDGSKIAAVSSKPQGGEVRIADVKTGEVITAATIDEAEPSVHDITWSPDGRFLVSGRFVFDASPPFGRHPIPGAGGGYPEFSPNGQWAAVVKSWDWGEVVVVRTDTGQGRSLGPCVCAGWDATGLLYFIRWPGYEARYVPDWPD